MFVNSTLIVASPTGTSSCVVRGRVQIPVDADASTDGASPEQHRVSLKFDAQQEARIAACLRFYNFGNDSAAATGLLRIVYEHMN